MTDEEEKLFRAAAREALSQATDIVVASGSIFGEDSGVPLFSLARFTTGVIAILVPDSWGEDPSIDERCQAILRQESKALSGQSLD